MGPVYRCQCRIRLRAVRALPARSGLGGRGGTRAVRRLVAGDRSGTAAPRMASRPADTTAAIAAFNLAESIRRFGHLAARLDPLGFTEPIGDPSLHPQVARPDRPTRWRRLPASIVGGPAAEGSANALAGHRTSARHLLRDDRSRLQPRLRAGGARLAAAGRRDRPVPAAARSHQRARVARSHHAGRDLRDASCIARSRARRAFRSKAST